MAVAEVYSNIITAEATLNGAINSGVTSLVVSSAAQFPATPQFRIRVDDEIMLVTGVAGTTFTIMRAAEGTTAASHTSGVSVHHVLTRDGLKGVGGSILLKGAYASRPAAGVDGRIYLPTDGYYKSRDNGTSWDLWGPDFPLTEVDDSTFSWINQLSATTTTTNGGVHLLVPATGTEGVHARVKSLPVAPYTITMAFLPMQVFIDFSSVGLCLRQSGSGALVTWAVVSNSFFQAAGTQTRRGIYGTKWSSATVAVADYADSPVGVFATDWQCGPVMYLQINDDNTNLHYRISNDGVNFFTVLTTTSTDFVTADQFGFFVRNFTTLYDIGMTVLSIKVT